MTTRSPTTKFSRPFSKNFKGKATSTKPLSPCLYLLPRTETPAHPQDSVFQQPQQTQHLWCTRHEILQPVTLRSFCKRKLPQTLLQRTPPLLKVSTLYFSPEHICTKHTYQEFSYIVFPRVSIDPENTFTGCWHPVHNYLLTLQKPALKGLLHLLRYKTRPGVPLHSSWSATCLNMCQQTLDLSGWGYLI
jgi:hypothetical protein